MKSSRVPMLAVAVLLLAAFFGATAQAGTCTLPNDPAEILNILFPLVDTNGDDGLSLAELTALYADIPAQYYDMVDSNRDGRVTMAELTPLLPLLPALLPDGNLLSYVDTNGNGAIEYAEVSQYVTPAQFALLDKDRNGVVDCTDLPPVTPPVEGETPPTPPPCPLPTYYLPGVASLAVSILDTDQSGGLSMAELLAAYPIPTEYQSLINVIDTNHNGQVEPGEMVSILSAAGIDLLGEIDASGDRLIQYAEVSEEVTSAQFALLDRNGNGVIDCGDLPAAVICPLPKGVVPSVAKLLMLIFDSDGSGGLGFVELSMLSDQAATNISFIDTDQSGEVDAEELVASPIAQQMQLLDRLELNHDGAVQYTEVEGRGLSPEKFALVDLNGDGVFDCHDLDAVIEGEPAEGELTPPVCPLPADIVAVLARMLVPLFDTDQSGGLSLAEIQAVYPIPAEYVGYFPALDFNGNGQIDADELVSIVSVLSSDPLGMIDTNGDRAVQYSEVSQYVTPAQFALLDRNGNGAFDCGDLTSVSPEGEGETALPCAIPNVNSLVFDAVFAALDANHDGGVAMGEVTRLVPWLDASQLQVFFTLLGAGGNGLIPRSALDMIPSLLSSLAAIPSGTNMLGLVDVNGDGLIQLSEASPYVSASVFAMFDANANGVLDCEDVNALLQGYGTEGEPAVACPLPDIRPMIGKLALLLDKNHDGLVCADEASGFVTPLMGASGSASPVNFFAMADQDGDGCLNARELAALANLIPFSPVLFLDGNGNGVLEQVELAALIGPAEFALADANHNGAIDCEDLAAIVALLGGNEGEPSVEGEPNGPCPLPADAIFAVVVRLVDVNGDGGISLAELQAIVPQVPAQFFTQADTNGDGVVDEAELRVFASIPVIQTLLPIPVPTPADMLAAVDTNHNGVIEFAEISSIFPLDRFAAVDANHNGVIDCEDLVVTHPAEGEGEPVEGEPNVFCPVPVDSLFNMIIRLVDLNGDGGISLQELQTVEPEVPVQFFALGDTNGDGVIDEAELKALVLSPPIQTLLPLPTPADIFDAIDLSGDDVFQYEELSSYFSRDRFDAVDANHNGVIDCEDLAVSPPAEGEVVPSEGEGEPSGLDDLLQGLHGSNHLAALITDAFDLLDTNGDGALSYAEISGRIKLPRAVFNAADTNGDGLVTWEEVSALARQAGDGSGSVIDLVRKVAGRFGNQFFAPGDVIRVTLRLIKHGDGVLSQIHLLEALPEGWVVNLVSGAAGVSAKSGAANVLVLDWSNATAFPLEVVYEATAPANASGLLAVTGQADYEMADGGTESTGAVASVLAEALPQDQAHTADVNGDWHLSLSEVLRVVQLYNAGGYGAEAGTEDGFAPGSGKQQGGVPHDADYTGDWTIDISELLRVVQLFNAPGGAYYRASGTEDGFVPGLF